MASRRLLSTRSRTNTAGSSIPPPAASRPRSVLAKSNSSLRSGLATPAEELVDPSPAPKPSRSQTHTQLQEDPETNIRVVIRCRRRSEREIQENSPIIVSTNGPRGEDITIETAAPVSSFGVVTLPPTRTYPFDAVFGPEADQALLYNDVVSPMLDEVLMGYNCTLFAYGQTGTGKTFTMQGDLTTTPMGNPSPQAGMIPRVLIRLFNQLESSGADYSVKISFVELYNEELRDLLAADLAAPMGSTQPMGLGTSKDSSAQGSLKIFDDSTKKGVFIQGLEEASVKDAADALALLVKGSQRRQIAATKFNDHSSRSHSVFSVTVHLKETSTMGEDLMKVGKLNLVDLAGSENIGRSGAENKRAREAGMINQSLLTLGRVINALVDRSVHVPYRESKLTRLLQDSLGGRTKTCIIATVSPARSNMEETLSTLDYAIRAKSIRNRPEVNQRMTRNALIKEYVAEIQRLRADLLATREKNGIIVAEETWNEMSTEKELRETELQEAYKQIEILKGEKKNVMDEFEQSVALLMKREEELGQTRAKLKTTEGDLAMRDTQLKMVRGELEDEVVVRQAYQDNEPVLDGLLSDFKTVTQDSVDVVGGLHAKLERKSSVLSTNLKAVSLHSKSLYSGTQVLTQQLDAFVQSSNQHIQKLKTEIDHLPKKGREMFSKVSARLDEQTEKVNESLQIIRSKEEISSEALEVLRALIIAFSDSIKVNFSVWVEDLRAHCESISKEAEASSVANFAEVEKAFKELSSISEAILQEAHNYIIVERKSLEEAKAMADNFTDAEVVRLRQQNTLLQRIVESQKVKIDGFVDELIKNISNRLTDFTAESNRTWKEAVSQITDSNAITEKEAIQLGQEQGQRLETASALGKDCSAQLERWSIQGKRTRDGGMKTLATARTVVRNGLSDVQDSMMNFTTVFSNDLQQQNQKFIATCDAEFERESRAKRARIDTTDVMATEAQSSYRYVQRGVASMSRDIEAASSRVVSESTTLSLTTDTYRKAASSYITDLAQATQSLVAEGTKEDRPTGATPRKRRWSYVDEWPLTKSRDVLLNERRQHGTSSPRIVMAEHLPLPEEDEGEDRNPGGLINIADDNPVEPKAEPRSSPVLDRSSPPAQSLSSSASSTSAPSTSAPSTSTPSTSSTSISLPTAPPPAAIGMRKMSDRGSRSNLKLPSTMGTLKERSTNVLGARGSRRTQR